MNRQKRLQQILDSSLKAFARDGYESTSVSGLVKEAQVSRGTFYLYFNSKKEIFDALIDRFMSEVVHHVSLFDAIQLRDVDGYVRNLSSCLSKNRQLSRVMMFDFRSIDKAHNTKINTYIKQCYKILQFNIEDAIRNGHFRPIDSAMMARSMIGTIKEFMMEWSTGNDIVSIADRIQSYLNFIKTAFFTLVIEQDDVDPITTTEHTQFRDITAPKSTVYSS